MYVSVACTKAVPRRSEAPLIMTFRGGLPGIKFVAPQRILLMLVLHLHLKEVLPALDESAPEEEGGTNLIRK